jgi:hypothetical protein
MATLSLLALTALFTTHSVAQQRTIYDREGTAVGRYTTDTQGTTTLYGRDGRVIGRASVATIMMDGVGGSIVGGAPGRTEPKKGRR